MNNDFSSFILWEAASRDTIDFKKIYVDIAGDLVAGLLLSQIIYWYLPGSNGESKLRVEKKGYMWIAKEREDWWDEIRITPKQFDRACKILEKKGILIKECFMFNGFRTIHIRLDFDNFMAQWNAKVNDSGRPVSTKGKDRFQPKVKTGIDESVRPITETTSETTSEIRSKPQKTKTAESNGYTSDQRKALNRLGEAIANEVDASTVQNLDELRAITLTGYEIAKIAGVDITVISQSELKELAQLTGRLWLKPDIDSALPRYKDWWYADDWRGKQGQPPTLKLIASTWGQFEATRSTNGNGAKPKGPTLTSEQRAVYEELLKQNNGA